MSSANSQLQGDFLTFSSKSLSSKNGKRLNKCCASLRVEIHRGSCMPGRLSLYRSSGPFGGFGKKQKPMTVAVFQGREPNHEVGGGVSKSKKKSLEVTDAPHDFENSSAKENWLCSYPPDAGITTRSILACNVFSQWLVMLHPLHPAEVKKRMSSTCEVQEISDSLGTQTEIHEKGWRRILKVAWCGFMHLDATLKIILLTFIPCFASISAIYETEVLKELTPLWILGPLIVAFDIKMFQAISRLYVFSFKQAGTVIRNIPWHGKIKEATEAFYLQKLLNMKSLDYKMVAKLKFKKIQQWKEKTAVALFELLWPYYWRTKSFLVRSKLV